MSTRKTWAKRGAVVGTVSALALGGAITFAGTASADVSEDSFTVSPVVSTTAPDDDVTLGDVVFEEEDVDDIFQTGSQAVTLTLSAGATFNVDDVEDDARLEVRNGGINEGNGRLDASNTTVAPVVTATTITFNAVSGTSQTLDTLAVTGLNVDVAAGATGTITLTGDVAGGPAGSFADDEDPAIQLQGSGATIQRVGGQDFPDALSANYVAGQLDTGTLLTRPGSLPVDTRQAIVENDIERVFIVGGTTAVSEAVAQQLRDTQVGDAVGGGAAKIQVIRLGGANRYDTNTRVNSYTEPGFTATSDRAIVASGEGFADAIAGGPLAYATGTTLILTPGASLGAAASQQLEDRQPNEVDVLGGTVSISEATANDIADASGVQDVNRIAGAERTETAANIARFATSVAPYNAVFTQAEADATVAVANGAFFADALTAGPLVGTDATIDGAVGGAVQTPILLSQGTNNVGPGLTDYLNSKSNSPDALVVFGLTSVTPNSLVGAILAEFGDPNPPTVN